MGPEKNGEVLEIKEMNKEVEKVQHTPETEENAEEENVEMENEQVEEGCEEMEIKGGGEVLVDNAIDKVKEEKHEEGEAKNEKKKNTKKTSRTLPLSKTSQQNCSKS